MDRYLGKTTKHEITNQSGVTLIPEGTILTEDHLRLLNNHSVDPMTIPFASEAESEEPCKPSISQAVQQSKALFDSIGTSRKIPVLEIRREILPVVQNVSEHSNVFELFKSLKATDEYTFQHNIAVGVLSTLIGRWLHLSEVELSVLSLAATLHDVGKVRIPLEILNKPGKLTADEYAIIKKHTVYGYELLKETPGLNHRVALVALQHHERNDGKGYPLGLQQDQVDVFSRIVAVADIFHAMSSKRPYHNPISFHEIVSQMRKGIFGELDPGIVSVFLENIEKKMVGEHVRLTDGRVGEVVYLNPHHYGAPLVKIGSEFVDLSTRNDLHIQEISI